MLARIKICRERHSPPPPAGEIQNLREIVNAAALYPGINDLTRGLFSYNMDA